MFELLILERIVYPHLVYVAVFIDYAVAMRVTGRWFKCFHLLTIRLGYSLCVCVRLFSTPPPPSGVFTPMPSAPLVVKLTKLTLALCVDTFAPISTSTRVIFRWPTSFYYFTRTCLCLVKQQFCVCVCVLF